MTRLAAIVGNDLRVRFRRPSTAVIFLLLMAAAYPWVPDPSTGRALMQMGGRRALYNSAAIGMATASLAALFIGLTGFYAVANAVRRDLRSRCGTVIAATTLRTGEYIVGTFLGNAAFLVVFTGGFMLASMAMVLVRGEAPLEPLTVARHYLLLVPPVIVFVSVMAVVFESVPWLAGRFGDVVYFFTFLTLSGAGVAAFASGFQPAAWVDVSGFAFILGQMKATMGADAVSIGASRFDPSKPLFVFDGLRAGGVVLAQRLVATFMSLPLLAVAVLSFHRFDPARVTYGGAGHSRGLFARINTLLRFLRPPIPLRGGAALADAMATLASMPVAVAVIAMAVFASAAGEPANVLPLIVAVYAVLIAGIATRDAGCGTLALIHSVPRLRERFLLWKFQSSLIPAIPLFAIAMLKSPPARIVPLLVGIAFVAASATAFGAMTSNPKAFIVLFLSFWYVVQSDRGSTPALDFGGWYGTASAGVTAAYALAAVVALATAWAVVRLREA